MPHLLTKAGMVMCGHGIQAQPTPAHQSTKVTIDGQPVMLLGPPFMVSGCPNSNAAAGQVPCTAIAFVPPDATMKVLVENKPVIHQDAGPLATCAPPANPQVMGMQIKVEGT